MSGNTEIFQLIPLTIQYRKCSNETLNTMINTVRFSVSHTELNNTFKLRSGVPARRFTLDYLFLVPQNVQDSDVGQLELFLICLNVKYERRLQNFTNAFRSRKVNGGNAHPSGISSTTIETHTPPVNWLNLSKRKGAL